MEYTSNTKYIIMYKLNDGIVHKFCNKNIIYSICEFGYIQKINKVSDKRTIIMLEITVFKS